ncbi:hypothetical protein OH76DRAFT_1395693 [Lentinus brumalis]|uniref:Phosphatidylinositol N-acetylglucosaminyltransferase subunit H conserved domain-containing protein n=1 Tax=Lentinus brumalis TaxID=2498619 RepID=A0A371DVL0_9APHY|nr:hypothetical protein OH76DRAFT_1395693 [Polyporus brumalis]
MQRTTPLHDHPEFCITQHSGWREYRVNAPGSRRPGASRIASLGGLWFDAFLVLAFAYHWDKIGVTLPRVTASAVVISLYLYLRLTRVLWESVVVFPMLGIQLETHRGVAGYSLLASRKFVPWSCLEDFLINEAIHGWDIRYYLVAVTRTSQDALKLEVAFESILPRFPILLEVYHGVQGALQDKDEHVLDT